MARVLMVTLVLLPHVIALCPRNCYCGGYWTQCSHAKVQGIPLGIRNTTEEVLIEWDNITALTQELFDVAGLDRLHKLVFDHTQILNIERNAFERIKKIQSLTISYNLIDTLQPGTFLGLHKLTRLSLAGNYIDAIPTGAFEGLTMLTNLDLSKNQIEKLSRDTFNGMRQANSCKPVAADDTTLPHRRNYFDLSSNFIEHIEPGTFLGLCVFTYLDLSDNNLSVLYSDTFRGLRELRSLDLRANYLRTIETGSFNELSCLTSLYTADSHMLNNSIEIIHAGIFEGISRLIHLDLSYFDTRVVEEGVFRQLKFLAELDLSDNKIQNLSSGIFYGLVSLRRLSLSANNVKSLDLDTFQEISKISNLDLSLNKIQILSNNVFRKLESLQQLTLYFNRIRTIRSGAFNGLSQLKDLDLRTNKMSVLTRDMFIDLVKLKNLLLSENNIHTVEQYAFRGLGSLKFLDLSENNINIIRNGTFDSLDRLNYLNLGRNDELIISPGALKNVQVLKIIGLNLRQGTDLTAVDRNVLGGLLQDVQVAQELRITGINGILQPGIFTGLNILTLDLSYNDIRVIQPDTFVGLSTLTALVIAQSKVRKIFAGSFRHLRGLTELNLDVNKIQYLEPGIFEGLTSLDILSLLFNDISTLSEGVFGPLCAEHIDSPCRYATEISRDLRASQHNSTCNMSQAPTKLRHINLSFNKIIYIHPNTFIHNMHLRSLLLRGNLIFTLDTNFLYIPSLWKLDISECNISELPTEYLKCVPELAVLDIYYNRIESITVDLLKQIGDLEILALSGNPLACDCSLKDTWNWIIVKDIGTDENILDKPCADGKGTWFDVLPGLECNTSVSIYQPDIHVPDNLQFFKLYVEPVILGLILLTGALGNGFLLCIFIRHPGMRTGPNACILNLSIGDCLSLLVNLPLSYWDILNVSWQLGLWPCKVFMASKDLTVGVTVFSVVALSAQRYHIAARPFRRSHGICGFSERKTTALIILAVWGLALGFALPAFLTATVDTRCLYTAPDHKYLRRTWTIQLLVFCVIPVFVICFFNLRTAQHLKESVHNMPGENQTTVQAEGRSRVANMVVVLTIVFCVSYVPNFLLRVLFVWSVIEHDSEVTFAISFMSFCLFFCNTCFNPIALFSMSTTYRHLFLQYLPCRRMDNAVSQNAPPPPQGEIPLRLLIHPSQRIRSQQ